MNKMKAERFATVRKASEDLKKENFGGIYFTDKGEKDLALKDGHLKVRLRKVKFAYLKFYKGIGKLKRVCAISNPIYFK